MNILDSVTKDYLKKNIPAFNVGDQVKVHIKIKEGNRERIQVFEGFVLKRQNGGIGETFTVRRIASGVGVEKTFPIHSPWVEKIEIVRRGDVRRAKLNYMRGRTGKAAKIKVNEGKVKLDVRDVMKEAEEIGDASQIPEAVAEVAEEAVVTEAAEEVVEAAPEEAVEAAEAVEETVEATEEVAEAAEEVAEAAEEATEEAAE